MHTLLFIQARDIYFILSRTDMAIPLACTNLLAAPLALCVVAVNSFVVLPGYQCFCDEINPIT